MTLHEIEEALRTLQSRHGDLNEGMLATLLRSGGWEEKNIQEALFLFRSKGSPAHLPPIREDPLFEPQADEGHLLMGRSDGVEAKREELQVPAEKQSFIPPTPPTHPEKDELPHNLPLRPFETSEHIWPFSRYKDVFYGDLEVAKQPERELPKEEIGMGPEAPPVPTVEPTQVAEPEPVPEIEIVPVPLTKGDEGLVVLAFIMLLAVLLLLGYMYSNGRF